MKSKGKPEKTQENNVRSTVFDLVAPDPETRQKVINSIRDYRTVARMAFSAYTMAQIAGAKITDVNGNLWVSSDNEAARSILSKAFGQPEGKAQAYELRTFIKSELRPTWFSKTWDSLRKDLERCWAQKDPELGVRRGNLILSGRRGLAQFRNRGIEFADATVKPFEGHTVSLSWDHDIGEVTFKLPRLDGGRYAVWKCLRDKVPGWERGSMYLSERDGGLILVVTHRRPMPKSGVDKDKVMTIEISHGDVENLINMSGNDETFSGDKISAEAALSFVREMKILQDRYTKERRATGNPHKQWGTTKIWGATVGRQNRATKRRDNGTAHWNHVWSRRVVNHAQRIGAGTIIVVGVPRQNVKSEFEEKDFFGYSWPWAQFRVCLEYKAKEIGSEVRYVSAEDLKAAG